MSFASVLVEAGTSYPPRTHRFISTFVVRIELFFLSLLCCFLFFVLFIWSFLVFFLSLFCILCSILPVSPYCIFLNGVRFPFRFIYFHSKDTLLNIKCYFAFRSFNVGWTYWWSFLKRVMCTKLDIFQFINVTWALYQVSTWSLNRYRNCHTNPNFDDMMIGQSLFWIELRNIYLLFSLILMLSSLFPIGYHWEVRTVWPL